MTNKYELIQKTFPLTKADQRFIKMGDQEVIALKDACDILNIANSRDTRSRLNDKHLIYVSKSNVDSNYVSFPNRGMYFITEQGFYDLVLQSRKPEAQAFKRWVCEEVLTSIRKHGGYVLGQEKVGTGEMTREQFIAEAVKMASSVLQEQQEKLARFTPFIEKRIKHVTIRAYAEMRREYLKRTDFAKLSSLACKLCNERGIGFEEEQQKVINGSKRYGKKVCIINVNRYPIEIVHEAAETLGIFEFPLPADIAKVTGLSAPTTIAA